MKKTPRQRLIATLDKEISLLVREKGYCEASDVSACGGVLQDAHIIGRSNHTIRWDLANHLSLCWKHHLYFCHSNPADFTLWYQTKYPDRWQYLLEARKLTIKWTEQDLKDKLEAIRNKDTKSLLVLRLPLDKPNT